MNPSDSGKNTSPEGPGKKCTGCNCFKSLDQFSGEKKRPDGRQVRCKDCYRAYKQRNKEAIASQRKAYGQENKDAKREYDKIYRQENRETLAARIKAYYQENKEAVTAYKAAYANRRLKEDPIFRLVKNLRRRTRHAIKNGYKSASTLALLGCTGEEAMEHLESLFYPHPTTGEIMTRDNNRLVDGWHVDHIRPLADFDLTDPEQQKIAFHYTNLQPLWAEHNLSKNDSLDWEHPAGAGAGGP